MACSFAFFTLFHLRLTFFNQRFPLIYKFPLTISYQLLCIAGHRVLHQVVIGIDTTHLQEVPLLEDNSPGRLEELISI